jgi:hypothetical protein
MDAFIFVVCARHQGGFVLQFTRLKETMCGNLARYLRVARCVSCAATGIDAETLASPDAFDDYAQRRI